jgi:hypothetical protein
VILPVIPIKKPSFIEPTKRERVDLKLALRRAKQAALERFSKNGKIPLLYPIAECDDQDLHKDQEEFKTIGNTTTQGYKVVIKKVHRIYNERIIGYKVKTEFILSHQKLHILIEDVKFIRRHYKEIKKLTRQ